MKLRDHTGADLLKLPVDALAMLVLEEFRGWPGNDVQAYFLDLDANYRDAFRYDGVSDRLGDAWAWLEAHALIGLIPRPMSSIVDRRITAAGVEALERGLVPLMAGRRLDVDLHETLSNVRSLYLLGQGGLAAFASLKQVEIRVRAMAGFSNDSVGTKLMTDAFRLKPEFGPLTDPDAEGGEREAIMFLFRGAIGTFKNPQSHRAVDDDDPVLASEIVLLADLLMRLLDRIEARQSAP